MLDDSSSVQSFTANSLSETLQRKQKLSFIRILGIASSQLAPSILFMVLPTYF